MNKRVWSIALVLAFVISAAGTACFGGGGGGGDSLRSYFEDYERLVAELDALQKDAEAAKRGLDSMEDAVRRYAVHDAGCVVFAASSDVDEALKCTCGLNATLSRPQSEQAMTEARQGVAVSQARMKPPKPTATLDGQDITVTYDRSPVSFSCGHHAWMNYVSDLEAFYEQELATLSRQPGSGEEKP